MRPAGNALALVLVAGLVASACAPRPRARARPVLAPPVPAPAYQPHIPWGTHTVATRLAQIGPTARRRWKPFFDAAVRPYPAGEVLLVVFKRERRVAVYAGRSSYDLALVREYPVTAASGGPGPKLREGDRQVPEGLYDVDLLNPNSSYHVSLRLDYPNDFDRRMARRDGRTNLGSAIMIHGSDRSIGCVAVGDQAAEDLFVLAADSGLHHLTVMIVPRDFRRTGEQEILPGQPAWVRDLYATLDGRLRALPDSSATTARNRRPAPTPTPARR